MAGDNNYFDADAYLEEQRRAITAAVLGANQNGVTPLPDTAPTTAAAQPDTRENMFRRAMNVGVSALPNLSVAPGILGTIGAVARNAEQASPGTLERIAPREQIQPHGPYGPSNAFKRPETGGPADTFALYPDVQPAPTLQDQARKAVGAGAGFGGGEGLGGLLGKYRGAQQEQVDTMGHGADLQLDLGQNKADAQTQMADLRAAQAEQMRRDAERQASIEQAAQAQHENFLARSQQMADQITAQQVDPTRFLHNADAKTQFIIGLGSAIGGANAAANGGTNQFLDRLDNIMDRDFKGQLANLDNAHRGLSARNTLFGQVMAETQDRRLADMQARDLMYTAMKTKLLSDADRLGVPEIMTQAKVAANEIENKQKNLQTQMAQQSYQSALAAQQAAAARQAAAEKAAWEHSIEVMKLNQEQQKIDIAAGKEGPGSKETGERKVVIDGQDALAVNKTAAEKWNEYNHGRAVFATALQELKAARERGDVGAYNAARANLIEEYPKLLGYTRAPTEGQIKATVGPEAIPEYNHWYNHVGTLGATYAVQQGRAEEKLKILDKTLAVSDKAMRENTFGANAPTAQGATPPGFKPDPPKGSK